MQSVNYTNVCASQAANLRLCCPHQTTPRGHSRGRNHHGLSPPCCTYHKPLLTASQNALFNSALRQSTSIRKDLDLFADSSSPSPALQGQISASLTSFARTIDDYGKLAKQEPIQTKQEKALERAKTFKAELSEYRDHFGRIKSANEDVVRMHMARTKRGGILREEGMRMRGLTARSKHPRQEQSC
jgi:hypothetical protein